MMDRSVSEGIKDSSQPVQLYDDKFAELPQLTKTVRLVPDQAGLNFIAEQ